MKLPEHYEYWLDEWIDRSDAGRKIVEEQDFEDGAVAMYHKLMADLAPAIEALRFYGDKEKYFIREKTVGKGDVIFASTYDDETGESKAVDIERPLTSRIFECSAQIKVDAGKTAQQALAKLKEKGLME